MKRRYSAVSLSSVDTKFVECRGPLRHAWFRINPPAPTGKSLAHLGERISVRCERCGKERHEVHNRKTGALMSRRYDNPKDYVAISRDFDASDLRLELLKRWNTTRKARSSGS